MLGRLVEALGALGRLAALGGLAALGRLVEALGALGVLRTLVRTLDLVFHFLYFLLIELLLLGHHLLLLGLHLLLHILHHLLLHLLHHLLHLILSHVGIRAVIMVDDLVTNATLEHLGVVTFDLPHLVTAAHGVPAFLLLFVLALLLAAMAHTVVSVISSNYSYALCWAGHA